MAASETAKVTEDPNFQGGIMSPNSKQTFAEIRFNPPTVCAQKIVLDEETFELAFLKCSMCKGLYNLANKSPRLLPCHHAYCLECILKFYKVEVDYRESVAPSLGTPSFELAVPIMCPKCSSTFLTTRDGINELSTDHRVVQLIDFVETTERHEAAYCPKHATQCLNFFCERCKQSVCRDCTVIDHKECVAAQQVLDMQSAKDKYTPVVEKGVTKMEEEIVSLKEKKEECEKALAECQEGDQDIVKEIKQSFDKIRKAIDDREKELLTMAKNETGGGRDDIEEKVQQITEKQKEVAEILATLKSFKDFDNLTKLYTNFQKIQNYETVPAFEKTTIKAAESTMKFVGREESTILHRIEKYGEVQSQEKAYNGTSTYATAYTSSYPSYGSSYGTSRYTGSTYPSTGSGYSSGTGSSYSSRYTPGRSTYKY